jgi:branched-chain amino acid transport system substrate-binding protein
VVQNINVTTKEESMKATECKYFLLFHGSCRDTAVSASAQERVAVKEWHIPTIMFLSGPFAGHGATHKWVAEQAAADINATGGIAGKQLVLDFCDSAMDPTKAASCMAKAVDAKALCTIGPLADGEAKGALPIAQQEGIFAFTGAGGTEAVRTFKGHAIFISRPVEDTILQGMPMWLKVRSGIKSVAFFVGPQISIWRDQTAGHIKVLKDRGLNAEWIDVPASVVDYGSVVVKAMGAAANAFAMMCTEEAAGKIVEADQPQVDPLYGSALCLLGLFQGDGGLQ